MSGFVGDLSLKQAETLQELQKRMNGVLLPENNDHYLLKWLRARQFDIEKAEKMLRDHLSFRQKWNVQSLVETWSPPEVLVKYMVGGLCGFDIEGSPVWYEPFGRVDTRGIIQSTTEKDLMQLKIVTCEEILSQLKSQSEKHGRRIEFIVIVFDLENVGLSHLWKPFIDRYTKILTIFEAQYPEMLKKCFIINAPRFFSVGFNLIKPFLSEDTKKKVAVLGGNYKGILREAIGEDLPAHYGGTACDPDGDPRCVSKIKFGGKIPESYYLKNEFFNEHKMKEVHIGHGSKVEFTFDIKEPGSIIKWEFITRHANIGFAVYFQSAPDDSRHNWAEVVEKHRSCSHLVPEVGGHACTKLGTYIVQFDNTFSWVRSKKVLYNIEVMKEDSQDYTG